MNARTFLPAVALAALALGCATSAADAANASFSLARDQVQGAGTHLRAYIRDDQTNLAATNVRSSIPERISTDLRNDDIMVEDVGLSPDDNLRIDEHVPPPTSLLGSALQYFVQISLFHSVGF